MSQKYSGAEIDSMLKTMVLLIDTREKQFAHIETALQRLECPVERCKLNYGDYSCKYQNASGEWLSLADSVVVERKATLDEIAGNLTQGRARFEREFQRAADDNAKVFLLIENGSWEQIDSHLYRSMFPPKSFKASLLSWQVKYNLTVNFCKPESSGEYIKGTLFYWLKNYLLNLEV